MHFSLFTKLLQIICARQVLDHYDTKKYFNPKDLPTLMESEFTLCKSLTEGDKIMCMTKHSTLLCSASW